MQNDLDQKRCAICPYWNADCLLEGFSGKNHENTVN